MVWHKETKLPKSDLIVIPGGFSYGDYLRSQLLLENHIIDEVVKAAKSGCLILVFVMANLTETGLPKEPLRNRDLRFINKDVYIKVINNDTRFSNKYKKIKS